MPKKYVFCIFHICQLLPGNRRTDIIEIGNKAVKMAESLTVPKPAQEKNPGKNRIRKIQEKIRISNFSFLGQIFRMDNRNCCFMVKRRFFLAI